MNFAHPHFAEPRWLWLAVLGLVLLAGLYRFAAGARRKQLARIAAPHFRAELTRSHSPNRRNVKQGLLLAGVALCGVALARPQWGELESSDQWRGDDVVFVLDCSRSMRAADVQPDRLQRAKFAILDFVRRPGTGRVGVVAFAGAAFLQCPLTFDYDALEDALKDLNERTIPVGGTDIGRALKEAFHALEKNSSRKRIVLLTDGEDLEQSGVKEAEALAKAGVTIYTVGVGTAAGAELRVLTPTGQMDYVRNERGEVVRSRLDEATLAAIAKATGGSYFPLGRVGEGLTKVRRTMETANAAGFARTRAQGVERFQMPLAMALACLVTESLIGTRRRKLVGNSMTTAMKKANAALPAVLALTLGSVAFSTPTETTNVTSKLSAPPAPVTARDFYNAGTKKLAAGKLSEAETMLQNALAQQDDRVQPLALFNLAHVRFELGREALKKSPPAGPAKGRARTAFTAGEDAIQSAEAALATDQVQKMVAAYMQGRGARKELRAAYDAVYRALEVHGRTLEKWRRSLGDFRGTVELNARDNNALPNAKLVERAIAELVDSVRELQFVTMKCAGGASKLGDLLGELKGRIPKDQMPPGAAGGAEEDEEPGELQLEELAGMKEGESKAGREMENTLSPEEAGNLLDGFRLGGDRRMPMGQDAQDKPRDRKRRDW